MRLKGEQTQIGVWMNNYIYNLPLVKEKDTRQKRYMTKFLLLGFLVLMLFLFYLWFQVEALNYGYKINEKKELQKELLETNKHLKLERDSLQSPAKIERIAKEKLHMEEPAEHQVIIVDTEKKK